MFSQATKSSFFNSLYNISFSIYFDFGPIFWSIGFIIELQSLIAAPGHEGQCDWPWTPFWWLNNKEHM